jgi:hypothetical protein
MKWWKHILAFLIAPLGAPVTFTVWSHLAIDPGSFSRLLSSLPGLARYATPIAYITTLVLGIPAILILSRKRCLTLPLIVIVGTLIGTITGLLIGFHIAGYDISAAADYFTYDLMSIYAPSTISGFVCSVTYWAILTFNVRDSELK